MKQTRLYQMGVITGQELVNNLAKYIFEHPEDESRVIQIIEDHIDAEVSKWSNDLQEWLSIFRHTRDNGGTYLDG